MGNLRPELRSSYKSIQLIACVTSENLMKYGPELVLQRFIEDVNFLGTVNSTCSYYIRVHTHTQSTSVNMKWHFDEYFTCHQLMYVIII